MRELEAKAEKEILVVAEDRAVRQLVKNTFSDITFNNLNRGIIYHFLVSKSSFDAMMVFKAGIKQELQKQVLVTSVDDNILKLAIPGCIFDSKVVGKHKAYFRGSEEDGYFWMRLSGSQKEDYTEGFESLCKQPDDLGTLRTRLAMWQFTSLSMLPSGFVICLTAAVTIKYLEAEWPGSSGKVMFVTGLAAGSLWIVVNLVVGQINRTISRTFWFARFRKIAVSFLTIVVLGLIVNSLSAWLTQ